MVRSWGRRAQGGTCGPRAECPAGLGQSIGMGSASSKIRDVGPEHECAAGIAGGPANSPCGVVAGRSPERPGGPGCRIDEPGPDRCVMENTLKLSGCGIHATLLALGLLGGCNSDEIRLESASDSQGVTTDSATGATTGAASMTAATDTGPTTGGTISGSL